MLGQVSGKSINEVTVTRKWIHFRYVKAETKSDRCLVSKGCPAKVVRLWWAACCTAGLRLKEVTDNRIVPLPLHLILNTIIRHHWWVISCVHPLEMIYNRCPFIIDNSQQTSTDNFLGARKTPQEQKGDTTVTAGKSLT